MYCSILLCFYKCNTIGCYVVFLICIKDMISGDEGCIVVIMKAFKPKVHSTEYCYRDVVGHHYRMRFIIFQTLNMKINHPLRLTPKTHFVAAIPLYYYST